MKFDDMTARFIVASVADKYLKRNSERFTEKEKEKFRLNLNSWMNYPEKATIADEVYDFLVSEGFYKKPTREAEFVSFLNEKYKYLAFRKILDVGAGRMCKLSQVLAQYGAEMYAIDPNIKLVSGELKEFGIKGIKKAPFVCDAVAPGGKGTNILRFDQIVALEPCEATEHIIRQALKYEKPFDILLCGSPHNSIITGEKFRSYEEWYQYLLSISSDIEIMKIKGGYVATNEKSNVNERYPEM